MSSARKHGGARKRGGGLGDFLANSLVGLGSGLGRGSNALLSGLFGGSKRRPRRGGASQPEDMPVQAPTSLVGKLNKIAKDSQVLSKGLKEFGFGGLSNAASTLGYGRRKRKGGAVKPVKFN
jgi:hypothetical protein